MIYNKTILDKLHGIEYFNDTICFPSSAFPIIYNENGSYILNGRILDSYSSINNISLNKSIDDIVDNNDLTESNILIAYPDSENEAYINESKLDNAFHEIYDKLPIFKGTKHYYIDYNILVEYHKTTSYGTTLLESFNQYINDNSDNIDINNIKLLINESDLIENIYLLKYIPNDIICIKEISEKDPIYQSSLNYISNLDESREFKFHDIPENPSAYSKEWILKSSFNKNEKNKGFELGKIFDRDDIEDLRMGRFEIDDKDEITKALIGDLKKLGVDYDDNSNDQEKTFAIAYSTTPDQNGKYTSKLMVHQRKKRFLGRVIASLRKIYRKFLKKQNDNIRANPEKANKIKKFLVKLANIIDRLVYKLEKLAS